MDSNLFDSEGDSFLNKKNIAKLLFLGILVLAIPFAVKLTLERQEFRSKATVQPVKFIESESLTCDSRGSCTTSSDEIEIELTAPEM